MRDFLLQLPFAFPAPSSPLPSDFSLAKQKLLRLSLVSPLPSQVISQGSAEFRRTEPFVSVAINTNGGETLLDLVLISRGMSGECEGRRLLGNGCERMKFITPPREKGRKAK